MRRKRIVAAALAVTVALAPLAAQANEKRDQENNEDRDGHSRYELAPISYLPLVLAGAVQERISTMYFLMQRFSYVITMASGVTVTSQDRVRLGGFLGGVLGRTYSPEDFVEELEVGTVYRAGNGLLAVAMEGDELLQDHRVIVFNGDYQYDPTSLPSLQQIEPAQLQKLQAYSLMVELAQHTLTAPLLRTIAGLNHLNEGALNPDVSLTPAQETEIPILRELIVGKVYRGPENTLLVVIPPAIVLED